MARAKEDLSETLAVPYGDQAAEDTPAEQAAEAKAPAARAEAPKKGTSSPRKRSAGKTAKKATKTAQKRTQPRKAAAKPEEPPLELQPVTTSDAERVSCYFHPDEFRELGIAKLDDRIPHNTRIRAMALVYNNNPRFKAQVDKIAKHAPRY